MHSLGLENQGSRDGYWAGPRCFLGTQAKCVKRSVVNLYDVYAISQLILSFSESSDAMAYSCDHFERSTETIQND